MVAAILLAAGLSRRTGEENKLLRGIEGKPMISRTIVQLLASTTDRVVLVTGHEKEAVEAVLPTHSKLSLVYNPDYTTGLNSSISRGIATLGQDVEGCCICLGDMPFLATNDYNYVFKAFENEIKNKSEPTILTPIYHGQPGHPVCFSHHFFSELVALPLTDEGAKSIVKKHRGTVRILNVESTRFVRDIDI